MKTNWMMGLGRIWMLAMMLALTSGCWAVTAVKIEKMDWAPVKAHLRNPVDPSSTLVSNYSDSWEPQETVKEFPVDMKIYDLGFVVYSKAFADRWGYPDSNVEKLPKGMQVLEFRMKTEGSHVECYLNVLLDNDLGLDVPTASYVARYTKQGNYIRFPKKLSNEKRVRWWETDKKRLKENTVFFEKVSAIDNKELYYSRNTRLATTDFDAETRGGATSLVLAEYSTALYPSSDYFSLNLGMVTPKLLEQPNLSLWLKKKGGRDYTQTSHDMISDFAKFELPQSFAQKMAEMMATRGRHTSIFTINSDFDWGQKRLQRRKIRDEKQL